MRIHRHRCSALIAGGVTALEVARKAAAAAQNDRKLWLPTTQLAACSNCSPAAKERVLRRPKRTSFTSREGARARGVAPSYPKVPEFFSKLPTAVIGDDAEVRVGQRVSKQFDYEVDSRS